MTQGNSTTSFPFRPNAEQLKAIEQDVSEMTATQEKLRDNDPNLQFNDRVAHQFQIAGGKVMLKVADQLPEVLQGVGLFEPGAQHVGIGRISTGLGTPHAENNPDFLGIMLAFRTAAGDRVDFLGINDPTSPAHNHRDFMDVLHATAEAAGSEGPFIAKLGQSHLGELLAGLVQKSGFIRGLFGELVEQTHFFRALTKRMGVQRGTETAGHILVQTVPTAHSSTAWQPYWTAILELSGIASKFTLVPSRDENRRGPELLSGDRHLSNEWKQRQKSGDVDFLLYWIPFVNEGETSTSNLTVAWTEEHKQFVGTVTFPRTDPDFEEAKMWAVLASEMGANQGNWVHNKENSIKEPATDFGAARKIGYQISQRGRNALDPHVYESIFSTGQIAPELAAELTSRRDEKDRAGHISRAT